MRLSQWITANGIALICFACAESKVDDKPQPQNKSETSNFELIDAKGSSDLFWMDKKDSALVKVGPDIQLKPGQEAAYVFNSEPKIFADGIITFGIKDDSMNENTFTLSARDNGTSSLKFVFSRVKDQKSGKINSLVSLAEAGLKNKKEISCGADKIGFALERLGGEYSLIFSGRKVAVEHRYLDSKRQKLTERCTFTTRISDGGGVNIAAIAASNQTMTNFQFSLPIVISAKPLKDNNISTVPMLRGPIGRVVAPLKDGYLPTLPIDATLSDNATEVELEISSKVRTDTALGSVSDAVRANGGIEFLMFENGVEQSLRMRQWFGGSVGAWSKPIKFTPVFETTPAAQRFACSPNIGDFNASLVTGIKCEMKIAFKYKDKAEKVEKVSCVLEEDGGCNVEYTFATPIERFQVLDASLTGKLPDGCSVSQAFDGTEPDGNRFAFIYNATTVTPAIECKNSSGSAL